MAADESSDQSGTTMTGAPDAPQPQRGLEAPAALREDQIANAVAFLTNPKVASASPEAKTTFLVKKGLTSEEIDEAYRRTPSVPAQAPYASTAAQLVGQQSLVQAAPPLQAQAYGQQPQHQLQQVRQPHHAALIQQQQRQPPPREDTSWSAIVLALTAVAAGGYGLQRLVTPYAQEYTQRWRGRPAAETAAPQAPPSDSAVRGKHDESRSLSPTERSQAGALADAIKAQTEELQSTVQQLKQLVAMFQKDVGPHRRAAPMEKDDAEGDVVLGHLETLRKELRADVRADLQAELRSFAHTISELTGDASEDAPTGSIDATPGRAKSVRPASPSRAAVIPLDAAHPSSSSFQGAEGGGGGGVSAPGEGTTAGAGLGGPRQRGDAQLMPNDAAGDASLPHHDAGK